MTMLRPMWRQRYDKQSGLTLIELMVALVLSMVLMTGMISVFVANKRTYQVQEGLARLQENGRFAIHLLTRDIRGAGYWGCGTQTPNIINALNNGGSYAFSYGQAVDGFDAVGNSWSPTLDISISGASPSPNEGSDVVTLRFSEGGGARVIQHNVPSADLKVVANADLNVDDIVMVSDCEDAAIFQITNLQTVSGTQTNVVHNTGTSDPGNAFQDLGKKFLNAEIVRVRNRTYYVADGAGGLPSLWRMDDGRTPQELVEGVLQMQVLYGVDTDSDTSANQYVTAAAVSDWTEVVSVRINLLMESIRDNVTDTPQSYTFNGSTVTAADKRLYKVFTSTVAIRNRLG